jgi:SAM-dependent MidA family methyltransferase
MPIDPAQRVAATLPMPDADAQAHSQRVAQAIGAEIAAAGGAIPFARYMELALYAPGLGYYSAGATKIGAAGDFVTAPELGPVFAACVADAVAPVLQQLGPGALVLELGGGTGAFAQVALMRLMELDALPARYLILEPSAELRQRQRARLFERLHPMLFELVEWVDGPVPHDWNGVLFANEVIDALPTTRFSIRGREVLEQYVAVDEGRFVAQWRPADSMLVQAVRFIERRMERELPDGYVSEVLPQLPYWIQAVAGGMQRGAMLFVDYGYPRGEFYAEDRRDGTLRAFYRHRMHDDAFAWPGLQDITASVDFTALGEAGLSAGFDLAGYCSQSSFLLGNGLAGVLSRIEQIDDEAERLARAQEVKRLTLPSEMGERFQAMGFSKDVEFGAAFLAGDLSYRL